MMERMMAIVTRVMGEHMKLVYLPANMAWCFVFGSSIEFASIQDMGGFGRLFSTRKSAVEAANACGITVDSEGRCK